MVMSSLTSTTCLIDANSLNYRFLLFPTMATDSSASTSASTSASGLIFSPPFLFVGDPEYSRRIGEREEVENLKHPKHPGHLEHLAAFCCPGEGDATKNLKRIS